MKKLFIILTLIISTNIYSQEKEEPFVEIYQTHDDGLYGRSEDRDVLLSLKASVFKRYQTLEANNEYNFLTGVVLSTTTVHNLQSMLENRDSIQVGFIKVSRSENIYTIEDDNIFLSFSFSFEKPNQEIINVIEDHYKYLPDVLDEVKNHYLENYVIRIHSAENILRPEAKEITYDEALIMATIIGDKDQWLWGIHDGRDYLKDLLF